MASTAVESRLTVRLYDGSCSEGPGRPLEVNAPEGAPFDGSGFSGHVLFLNRPYPDVQDGSWPYADQFQGKSRRFEFRLQGRFAVDPGAGEDIFFGIELAEAVGLSWALRSTAGWVMSVVRILCAARGVSYAYSLEMDRRADGSLIRPHLSFPLVAADAIVATPSGQQPPPLHEPLAATTLAQRQAVRLNMTDTFTFAYWSKQADFAAWEICNMPLGWSASFSSFIGSQSVHLTAYRLKRPAAEGGLHIEQNKRCYCRLVLSNSRAKDVAASAAVAKIPEAVAQTPSGQQVVEASPALGSPAERRREPRQRPWCLEEAELPLDELDRLWLHRSTTGSFPEEPDPGRGSRGWLSSVACCVASANRHGVR